MSASNMPATAGSADSRMNLQAGYRRASELPQMKEWEIPIFCPIMGPGITIPAHMSCEVTVEGRRFYIVSEPEHDRWRAQVLELLDDLGATKDMGIETTGETRGLADERALGVLQHRLRPASDPPVP